MFSQRSLIHTAAAFVLGLVKVVCLQTQARSIFNMFKMLQSLVPRKGSSSVDRLDSTESFLKYIYSKFVGVSLCVVVLQFGQYVISLRVNNFRLVFIS